MASTCTYTIWAPNWLDLYNLSRTETKLESLLDFMTDEDGNDGRAQMEESLWESRQSGKLIPIGAEIENILHLLLEFLALNLALCTTIPGSWKVIHRIPWFNNEYQG